MNQYDWNKLVRDAVAEFQDQTPLTRKVVSNRPHLAWLLMYWMIAYLIVGRKTR